MTTKYIALQVIRHNWEGVRQFTGRYDEAGEPIVRSVPTIIRTGEMFEVPDEPHLEGEADRLQEAGAARPATATELALAGVGQGEDGGYETV